MTYKEMLDAGMTFNLLSLTVYRPFYNGHASDCTNGGITAMGNDHIYIPCIDGPFKSTQVDRSLIMVEEKRGADYWALVTVDKMPGMIGPMAGGNIAYSSDSRCKRMYHIHDRFETQKLYDSMSI
jgi:hypothetical protein